MGRFRFRFFLQNGQWHSKNIIAETTNYSTTSTEWSLKNLVFTETSFGFKLFFDQIDTAVADMCVSNILITHSVC